MKIFRRKIVVSKLPSISLNFLKTSINTFFHFKNPISLLSNYIQSTSPKVIELRNGLKILCSNHPHDIITTVMIFSRKDYGHVDKDSMIIDIGANIGIFSLFGAFHGAAKIYAFEPCKESYRYCLKNIHVNHFQNRIVLMNLAVTGKGDDFIRFPRYSSPHNKILDSNDNREFDMVKTTCLKSFFYRHAIDHVDLLKIDCEGSEYEIIYSLSASILNKIKNIRLEYHYGYKNLINYLKNRNFNLLKFKPSTPNSGILWFSKLNPSKN